MKPELYSAIRSVLLVLGGIAVGKGWLDSTALDTLVSAAMVLVAAWGVYAKRPRSAEAKIIAGRRRKR
jgi:hypothetical protein